MASKLVKGPLIRHVTIRGYAQAEAQAARRNSFNSCVNSNKTVIAALENGSPITRVTVAFKAGCRYEPASELGISHVLRAAAGLTTKNSSAFMLQRQLAQIGASVSASGDREFIYYTLEATQQHVLEALAYLNNLVSNQEFRAWELSDNMPRLKYELAGLSPQVRAVDLLHKAAFRRGLGNSLFISPKRAEGISSESLQHYAAACLKPSRCAIAVVGGSMDNASLVDKALQLATAPDITSEPSKYYGGEFRKEIGGDLTHVAVAFQGAPAGTPQSLALAVAAKALGTGPLVKWGSYNSSLAKAIGNIGPFAAAGFNVSYSDSGLFGVILTVPKNEAKGAIKKTVEYLKKGSLSGNDIPAAKNQLKLQVLSEADDGASLAESLAAQCLTTGKPMSPTEIADAIQSVSDSDVSQAFAAATKTKLSMASVGNLSCVPYIDEI